jgi:hypothetical protein
MSISSRNSSYLVIIVAAAAAVAMAVGLPPPSCKKVQRGTSDGYETLFSFFTLSV